MRGVQSSSIFKPSTISTYKGGANQFVSFFFIVFFTVIFNDFFLLYYFYVFSSCLSFSCTLNTILIRRVYALLFSQPRPLMFSLLAFLLSTVLLPSFASNVSIVLFCSSIFEYKICNITLSKLNIVDNKRASAGRDLDSSLTYFDISSNCFCSSFKSTLNSLICLDTDIISKPYIEDLRAKSESSSLYREQVVQIHANQYRSMLTKDENLRV